MNKPLIAVLLLSIGWLGCDRKTPSKPVVAAAGVSTGGTAADEKEEEKTDGAPKSATATEETETTAPEKPSGRTPGAPKDEFPRKMAQWKLSPEEIQAELASTGRVVREKPPVASSKKSLDLPEPLDTGHLATVISIKFGADSHLFATKIKVSVDEGGTATLTGSVKSSELIGRAIFLALNTDGIGQVVSLLTADVAG
jgi:hypothetical protein